MLHNKFRIDQPAVLEKKILSGFNMYGRGGHLGHVTQISHTNFGSPYPWVLQMKLHLDWPNGFREEYL